MSKISAKNADRLWDETRAEQIRRCRAEERDNMLARLVPDRRCSSCECVKVRRKAWVVLNERRSTLLERLSDVLSASLDIVEHSAKISGWNKLRQEERSKLCVEMDSITKVQRSKICCRGCWIKFRNKARAYDVE